MLLYATATHRFWVTNDLRAEVNSNTWALPLVIEVTVMTFAPKHTRFG